MKIMLKTLAIGLATLLAVGCGSSPEPSAGAVPANMQGIQFPDWVIKGSGAFPGDEGKQVFYGVGSVSGISSSWRSERHNADKDALPLRNDSNWDGGEAFRQALPRPNA